jgi:acyl-CoA hydrolase
MLNDVRSTKTQMTWNQLADKESVDRTLAALKANGIDAYFVETADQARQKVRELVPEGAEVLNMPSQTLLESGIAAEILESGKYNALRNQWAKWNPAEHVKEMRQTGAAPDWAIGSVHAVTEEGQVVVASATGSQMPAYLYGAGHVVWVVGIQKIVKDLNAGFKRVYEHVLPLESDRAHKAYGVPGSVVAKLLVINKEVQPNRATLILVDEVLGF